MDPKEIQSDIHINSPKLKVEKTFESNYDKDKEILTYSIDMYNEKKDSIAKGIVLKDTLDIAEIEKEDLATFLAKNCEYVEDKEQKDFDRIIDELKSDEDEGREINLNEIL